MRPGPRRPAAGFTLIELLMVIAIIGILMTFILVASFDAVESARQRSTQSLIVKLDGGVADRLEALNSTRPQPNAAHRYLAGVYYSGSMVPLRDPGGQVVGGQRAQVIAQFDMIRAEFPETFLIQNPSVWGYPLNFGALPYTAGTAVPVVPATQAPFVLPLGTALIDAPASSSYGVYDPTNPPPNYSPTGTGIFGASYTAAAGFYKNLGYNSQACNGVDDNVNGLVDDWTEVLPANQGTVLANLNKHTHATARSEALYAVMVEGRGPFGSIFRREDFNSTQVADTDGDGLPEFIDGWGKPLQFYRWPVHFNSDIQKGLNTYRDVFESREKDPLDPNNQLVAPAWWAAGAMVNTGGPFPAAAPLSGPAYFFQTQFHNLVDPNAGSAAPAQLWNRSGSYARREYFSKFLIASSGRDQELGIAAIPDPIPVLQTLPQIVNSVNVLQIENTAGQVDLNRSNGVLLTPNFLSPITLQLQEAGADDITNHNASSTP